MVPSDGMILGTPTPKTEPLYSEIGLIHQQSIDQSMAYQVNSKEFNLISLGYVLSLDRQKKKICYQGSHTEQTLAYQHLIVVTELDDFNLGFKLLMQASKLQESLTSRILASYAQAAEMRSHKFQRKEGNLALFQRLMTELESEPIDIREELPPVVELQVSCSN